MGNCSTLSILGARTELWKEVYLAVHSGTSRSAVAEKYGISERTVYRILERTDARAGSVNWIRTEVLHRLPGGRSLVFNLQRQSGNFGTDLSTALELRIPLSIPMKWFPKAGCLRGRVYDSDTGSAKEGVLVSVGSEKVATDAEGWFFFPSLNPGDQQLAIDLASLGIGTIPLIALPQTLQIISGETSFLDIPVVRSCEIRGRVRRTTTDTKQNSGQEESPQALGFPGILVTATGETLRLQRLTDSRGYFTFAGLSPGKWQVTLAVGQLHEFSQLIPPSYEFELKPGVRIDNADFDVVPVEREVVVTAGK